MRADTPEAGTAAFSLPATMAEIFLALVAVVVMMVLALIPAIQRPQALAPSPPFEIWNEKVVINGKAPTIIVAEAEGLRRAAPSPGQLVSLDDVLDDRPFSDILTDATDKDHDILLVIRQNGQEAAFLFNALTDRLGIVQFYQLRVDTACDYLSGSELFERCLHRSLGGRNP